MAFNGLLKVSTATTLRLGPFVDATDGFTFEIGMAAAMNNATTGVRISKNGGALAARTTATEPVYDSFGYYLVNLDATDVGTVGRLKVSYGDAAVCRPREADFEIHPANVFDSLMGTDLLDVNSAQVLNTAIHAATEAGTQCVEVVRWGGSDIAATGVAGVPKVAVTHVNAAAQTATLDTIKAETAAIQADIGDASVSTLGSLYAILGNAAATLTGRIPAALGADGFMKSSLFGAMGTALTETAGQIAAAITKFFNKAVPTGTINSLPDVVAGGANGLIICGSNAALSVPSGITANITGTLATVTNLTNAPTAGDLTAVMKTSITAAMLSAGGSSGNAWTYTLTDADTLAAISGAMVWITSDIGGTTIVASAITNASGVATFTLTAGTYYVWRSKSGYNFTNPDTEVIA